MKKQYGKDLSQSVVYSCVHPELYRGTIYIRGNDRSRDHEVFWLKYADGKDAAFAVELFVDATKLINEGEEKECKKTD